MNRLSPRLAALAAMVKSRALLVDIGSDHGYLPLFLLQEGSVCGAVATDLREGPLQSAREHAQALAPELLAPEPFLPSRLTLVRTDGLDGLRDRILAHTRDGICDIVIAGMGGELIVSILGRAPWVQHPAIRLLLQPMTKPEAVRRFLSDGGFFTERDTLVREGDRIYQILAAGTKPPEEQRLQPQPMTALEALAGRREFWYLPPGAAPDGTPCVPDPLRLALFDGLRRRTLAALAGKRRASLPCTGEEALLGELDAAIAGLNADPSAGAVSTPAPHPTPYTKGAAQ